MTRWVVTMAALNGLIAVALGAMGAHALSGVLSERGQEIFETGVRYHGLHALALLGTAWALDRFSYSSVAEYAAWAFQAGIVLFCGSLYWLAFLEPGHGLRSALGPITPVGGLFLLTGWALLALTPWK